MVSAGWDLHTQIREEVSFTKGRIIVRGGLHSRRSSSGGSLRNLGWQDFKLLVGEAFRTRGYAVTETGGGGGADDGIDLEL